MKKFPSGGPCGQGPQEPQEFQCPDCGACESKGSSDDLAEGVLGLAKAEKDPARETANLPGFSDSHPDRMLLVGLEALDMLNVGLAVTTPSGVLLLANHAAQQVLDRRDGLELNPAGVLSTMQECTPALVTLIREAARASLSGNFNGQQAGVAVRRPSGRRAMTVLVRPVERPPATHATLGPLVLVFILDPELPVEAPEAELRQLYAFTSTEARLANLLMEGKTLNECCDHLGIRRSTGRTHLQHLFAKVGAQRQTELVSLLLKSIGLVRTAGGEKKHPSLSKPVDLSPERLRVLLSRVARATGAF